MTPSESKRLEEIRLVVESRRYFPTDDDAKFLLYIIDSLQRDQMTEERAREILSVERCKPEYWVQWAEINFFTAEKLRAVAFMIELNAKKDK